MYREDCTGSMSDEDKVYIKVPTWDGKKKCVHCGKDGHLASDCYSLTPAERAEPKSLNLNESDNTMPRILLPSFSPVKVQVNLWL